MPADFGQRFGAIIRVARSVLRPFRPDAVAPAPPVGAGLGGADRRPSRADLPAIRLAPVARGGASGRGSGGVAGSA